MDFIGTSIALDNGAFSEVALQLGVKAPEVWSILTVETRGCGFLPDRRPQILFERHIFSRLTGGQYDAENPDISNPLPGGYGSSGSHQYDRLNTAIALDEGAALQSASWGLAQIMGENFEPAGFTDVDSMVENMVDSENGQLEALATFLISMKLQPFLATHNWTAFARGYNGPAYAQNRYDTQLQGYYNQFSAGPLPDLEVRAVQTYLLFKGFDPHGVDGVFGRYTLSALAAFQQSAGLSVTGQLDSSTLQALQPS